MKFRSFLLKLKVWRLYRQIKKQKQRLQAECASKIKELEAKLEQKTEFYEKQLATERKRFELMLVATVDREYQRQHLIPISVSQANLEAEVNKTLPNAEIPVTDIAELLTFDQRLQFDDLKSNFWRDGINNGHSESDITTLWESSVQYQAMDDAKMMVGAN